MPPELKDYDWEASKPEGMTELTQSHAYNQVWAAVKAGLTPGDFRMLPFDEQAELTAFFYVQSRIESFYADEQRAEAQRKQTAMEAKANAGKKNR